MSSQRGSVVCVFSVAVLGGGAHAQLLPHDVIAISGTESAGTEAGTSYAFFDAPALDASGRVLFSAAFQGDGVTDQNSTGVYFGLPGQLQLTRSGATFSSVPGATIQLGGRHNVSRNGTLALVGNLEGDSIPFGSLGFGLSGVPGSLSEFVVGGNSASGTPPDTLFAQVFQNTQRINDAGDIVFNAGLTGPGVSFENNQGIWRSRAGQSPTLVARQGDEAPALVGSTLFFAETPLLSPGGRIVFSGFTQRPGPIPGGPSLVESALWSVEDGLPRVVARKGDVAPGYAPGVTVNLAIQPVINGTGNTVYTAFVEGPGLDFADALSVYADRPGRASDELLFRTGTQAPNLPAGYTLTGWNDITMNSQGTLAFGGEISGPGVTSTNDTVLYTRTDAGAWNIIAREGDDAPGVAGLRFGALGRFGVGLNGAGQIAIFSSLFDPAQEAEVGAGLWLWDPSAGFQLVAASGSLFEVAPGDVRIVDFVSADSFSLGSGLEDGRRSSFNEAGQLAFQVFFTDGTSGIFRTQAVPTPGVVGLLALAAMTAGRRRR